MRFPVSPGQLDIQAQACTKPVNAGRRQLIFKPRHRIANPITALESLGIKVWGIPAVKKLFQDRKFNL